MLVFYVGCLILWPSNRWFPIRWLKFAFLYDGKRGKWYTHLVVSQNLGNEFFTSFSHISPYFSSFLEHFDAQVSNHRRKSMAVRLETPNVGNPLLFLISRTYIYQYYNIDPQRAVNMFKNMFKKAVSRKDVLQRRTNIKKKVFDK